MHDYDDDIIIIIIHLKTVIIPVTTGATRTTPQPPRTCIKDNAIYVN